MSPSRTPTRGSSAILFGWDNQTGVPQSPSAYRNASSQQPWSRAPHAYDSNNSDHNQQQPFHAAVPRTPNSHNPQQQHQHQHQAIGILGRLGGAAACLRRNEPDMMASKESEIRHLTPPLLLLLRGLLLLDPNEFASEASWVFPSLADLVVVRNLEVRATVRELFSTCINPLLNFPATASDAT